MKNIGSLAMLLLAGAGYVASLPAVDVQQQNQVRAIGYDAYHDILAREPKKNKNKGNGGKSTSQAHDTPDGCSQPGRVMVLFGHSYGDLRY